MQGRKYFIAILLCTQAFTHSVERKETAPQQNKIHSSAPGTSSRKILLKLVSLSAMTAAALRIYDQLHDWHIIVRNNQIAHPLHCLTQIVIFGYIAYEANRASDKKVVAPELPPTA